MNSMNFKIYFEIQEELIKNNFRKLNDLDKQQCIENIMCEYMRKYPCVDEKEITKIFNKIIFNKIIN